MCHMNIFDFWESNMYFVYGGILSLSGGGGFIIAGILIIYFFVPEI